MLLVMNEKRHFTWNLLFIENDLRQIEGVSDFLRPNGFLVHSLNKTLPLEALRTLQPHLVLLDVMLPGDKDGFDILRDIRAKSDVPVIMVSARGSDMDKVVGLELGADDYVAKPFNPYELLARIKAVLRRNGKQAPLMAQEEQNTVQKINGRVLASGDFSLEVVST